MTEWRTGRPRSTGYKVKYDYPNGFGVFTCTKCKRIGDLPANYCMGCGKELEENQKKGLKMKVS